ncbi:hypothetical protein ACSYS8_003390 [Stenotrophomonas muris]
MPVHLYSHFLRLGGNSARQAQQQRDHHDAVHRQPPDPSRNEGPTLRPSRGLHKRPWAWGRQA